MILMLPLAVNRATSIAANSSWVRVRSPAKFFLQMIAQTKNDISMFGVVFQPTSIDAIQII